MNPDQAYIDYLKSTSASVQASALPASMEIYLLDQAQTRLHQRETEAFQKLTEVFDWRIHRNYEQALQDGAALVVTDAQKTILWTSHRFFSMTGYSLAEVIGRTPRFLQGPQTDPATVQRLTKALTEVGSGQEPIQEQLVNYRKDGHPYLCAISIDPLRNHRDELTHFVAVEWEIV